jgi:hypothetical protein
MLGYSHGPVHGEAGTGRDLAQVHAALFDKRATVVDVTDKEVIDLFQDGLYHHRRLQSTPLKLHYQAQRHDYFMGRRRRQGEC